MVFYKGTRTAFQNMGLKIGNSHLFLSRRQGNVSSSGTPGKEESNFRDAVSPTQQTHNTLDYSLSFFTESQN